ncbi:hypothetical protein TTHERM_00467980 (macronuclear) [Tetrahymena thermophila SB210]|uniref:Uncharacterized protein n=1 Tax=Tetrahymena thermophila (strain SB210) TaxID=312017 RepID=I7MIY8_TETTS|nr:hypothetical protein TTHERM_00467980 [Tetrahymena thermophila SB210]EAS04848.2 hypothetical protein TTHERM_00467980 [Tetrahymena thermophila SB210]|eukprot:XP_001025093.2 hypothetical protein TTHERM_00467980 [Tetrahymena thermophila SB210]
MSSQILERPDIQGVCLQYDNLKPKFNSTTDNFIQVIQCSNISNESQDNQNFSQQNQLQIFSNSLINDHQTQQLVNQNAQVCHELRSDSTNSIHLSNRQASPSNKQCYQQITPPQQRHYQGDDNSDSLNRSSNTKVNKGDDLLEFELLEQQVNNMDPENIKTGQETYLNYQSLKCNSKDNILSNNTDLTAQEILIAAKTPQPCVSQVSDKQIKMKPNLKKNYMSLEQLQMKCNISGKNNDLYNINSTDNKHFNQRDVSNIVKLNTISDATDCSDIFNRYNLANSESIDHQTDSLQLLLERAFQSKLKYDQLNANDQNAPQSMLKPPTPIQLEKQILSTLPPPSPINVQNYSSNNINKQNIKDSNSKIQIQFSNILDSLKKTNSSTTIGSHTAGSKSNSQQNCSIVHSKSGNKTPSSNQTIVLYQNDNYEKINIDDQSDPDNNKFQDQPNTKQVLSLNKLFAYNEQNNQNIEGNAHFQKQNNSNQKGQIIKSLSHANLQKGNQQRSISLSNAQDYAKILNRRRSSRMSSKESVESNNERAKSQISKEVQQLNKFFTNNIDSNENEELNTYARSMSNTKLSSKSTSTLFRLNQDFERRRAIQQEQIKQKEMKSKKSIEESNKQNISRGKLSKDQEANLVNKLFSDANRRQNIQVLQQKMKKIEEEQREQKSLEAQRESIMKRNSSNHNGTLYANVQSKIKSIINPKSQIQNFEENLNSNSLQRTQTTVIKHSYSKKNQNRTISPILKRTQNPLQKSDSQAHLNKTQIALQQFQNNEKFEEEQNNLVKNNIQMHTKSTNFIENLQFQFYTPSKPLVSQNHIATISKNQAKESEKAKNYTQQQLNHTNNSKSSYLKQLSSSKHKLENQQKQCDQNIPIQQHSNQQYLDSQNYAPTSVASIKKHLKNSKSTIKSSYESQIDQNNSTSKISLSANKQSKSSNRSLSKKPKITINIEEEEDSINQNQDLQNINMISGLKNISLLTPQQQNMMMNLNQNSTSSCQNNSQMQNGQYVSMKCTNSFFREKNPSTLASTNQNFIKLNRQMQYKYMSNNGNQTSKNSSVNQSQQQSMKNSILFPCKTPNNQANNGLNSNNKKSMFSFVNQSETSMDDQQFQQSRQSNLDTIKINLAQNKAQIVDNQQLSNKKNNFFTENQLQNNQTQQPQQKQEKVDEINKFITENPNFIQFMIQQYNLMQQSSQVNPYQVHSNNFQQNNMCYQQQAQQQYLSNNNNTIFHNKEQSVQQNKILTVDDLLELDTLNNYNTSQISSLNQIKTSQNIFPFSQQPQQKSQYQLISMSEIDQTPSNIQQQAVFDNYQQIQQSCQQLQPNQQQLNQFQKQQMPLNGILEDSYLFGSFQNVTNNGLKQNKNLSYNDVKSQIQYQSASGNSLELHDNELIEQNFQSANTLNPIFKSSNTIPSSNYIGNNISNNSTIEQHFSNLTYLQKSNQQFSQFN